MDDLHYPDFSAPNFSVPELATADLAIPGFDLPAVDRPDPYVPDLTQPLIPPDVEMPVVERPDPVLPDLTAPVVPPELDLPGAGTHAVPKAEYLPAVSMEARPGELSDPALALVRNGPDFQQLPPAMDYRSLYTTAQDMTSRLRHLGMLELGLEGAEGGAR